MLVSSLSEIDESVQAAACGYMLLVDICAKLRLLQPVAAHLSLFSLLVVEEDAQETFIVLAEAALLSSSSSRFQARGQSSVSCWVQVGDATSCCVAQLRVSLTVLYKCQYAALPAQQMAFSSVFIGFIRCPCTQRGLPGSLCGQLGVGCGNQHTQFCGGSCPYRVLYIYLYNLYSARSMLLQCSRQYYSSFSSLGCITILQGIY